MKPQISYISHNSFFRYILTGGIGFTIDLWLVTFLYYVWNIHYQIATSIGFLVGLISVYMICNHWVFSQRKMKQTPFIEFAIFAIIGLLGLALTHFLMWYFVENLSIEVGLSKCFSALIVLLWNYGARKVIIY